MVSSRTAESTVHRRWAVLAVLCLSLLVVSLDSTILTIALPALVRSLGASESQLQWIVDAYAVVFAGLLLAAGSIGDRIGRRRVFAVGLVVFGAGSAASAFATSVTWLVAARSVMGIGAAAIMPATLSILTDVFRKPDEQSRAIGIWSGATGLGIAIGPLAGGWLLAHYWWGSVFLINVPIAVVGLVGTWLVVPESRNDESRPIDLVGSILSVTGLAMLLWSIIESPLRGWTSLPVLAVGAGSLVVLAGFVVWELHAPAPMLVLEAFRDRRFSVAMAAVALAVFALMAALFVLSQYLQFSLGYSAFAAGLRILPIAAVLSVAAVASTRLDRWLGTKAVVSTGLLAVAAGLWELATTTDTGRFPHTLAGMLCLGFGAGLIVAPATASVMGALPRQRAGVGSATNSASLQIGAALGVAVIGSSLTSRYANVMTTALRGHPVPVQARQAITGSLGGALDVAHIVGGKLGRELATSARHGFVEGMDLSLLVGAAVVLASAVLVLAALPARATPKPLPGDTSKPSPEPPEGESAEGGTPLPMAPDAPESNASSLGGSPDNGRTAHQATV